MRIGFCFAMLLIGIAPFAIPAPEQPASFVPKPHPRGYVALRAPMPPTIDGKLDDEAWKAAPWSEDFGDIEGDKKPKPRYRTRMKMLWDANNLYIAAELDAVWMLIKRNVTQSARGVSGRGPFMIKLAYSEACQKLGELALRVLERNILTVDGEGPFVEERLRSLAFTIAAGTSQIQRNILGERVLGLPKEPR